MPIIVITGHADARTCHTALHNGVFDFVEKGFNPRNLLRVIRATIERDAQLNHQRSLRTVALE
jgi:two-component system C4-dicarboxylate transport response regulator DctD